MPGSASATPRLFAEQQIPAERLSLLGHTGLDEHLALYGAIDVALDPFPYNGCLTSLETLWMGVPLITLAGDRFVSRVGMSLLTTIGLPELIGQSPVEYVERAAGLARDLDRLEALRAGLRARLEQSPLCDRPRFARAIEAAYRATWRRWCAERTAR